MVTDENGLYHMRAGYYNVDIRRFVNQDILRGTLTNSQSLSRYSYVQGNPLSYSDPFGLSPYQTFSAIGHQILDIAGFAPGFGEIADVINAAWYAGEAIYYGLTGNHEMMMRSLKGMGCSLFSALPGIGSFIGQGMKMTIKGVDVGCTIIKGSKIIGYGASAVMSGYGSINGGLEMYRKYAVNGEQMGWHTFGEAGSVALMGVAAVGSGKMAAISANGTWCFTGDTLVATDEGAKPIEMIKEGDVVLSEDAETGEQSYQRVVQTFISESDTLIHVVTGEDEIEATAMHPFYVIGRGFVPAGELEAGDWLKDSQGRVVEVVEVWTEVLDEPVPVYNLEVEETHTYYVGTGMVLVHNNCGLPTNNTTDVMYVGPDGGIASSLDSYDSFSTTWGKATPQESVISWLDGGQISESTLKSSIPDGAKNTFIPSDTISSGYKYDFVVDGTKVQVKWHSPDANAAALYPGSNSGSNWTAQIKIGKKYLQNDGVFLNKNKADGAHIIIH